MDAVCGECGAAINPGEDFCGQCGAYLAWDRPTEQALETSGDATEVDPTSTADPARPGLAQRVKAAVGIGPSEQSPPGDADDVAPPGGATSDQSDHEPAGSTEPQPVIVPVKPGAPAPRPRKASPPTREARPDPGDLICGECGWGNKPVRKFCRHCGHDLRDAEVAHVAWWRRIFRKSPTPAGTRPKYRSNRGRLPRRLIALLVVLGLVVAGFLLVRPHARDWYEAVLDRVRGTTEVNVKGNPVASSSRRGHGPNEAIDGHSNTWWSPKGDGTDAVIWFRFDPIRLVYISVQPGGTAKDKEKLRQVSRPKTIELVLVTQDPKTKKRTPLPPRRSTSTASSDSRPRTWPPATWCGPG